MRSRWLVPVLTGLLGLMVLGPVPARADDLGTISAVKPVLFEAPDYASEVLGDPWDFDNAADIAGPADIANGVLTFVPSAKNQPSLLASTASSQAWGKDGRRFPIDADRYFRVSIRIWTDHFTQAGLSWTRCSWAETSCRGWRPFNVEQGWHTVQIGFPGGAISSAPAPWSGKLVGLRLTGVTGSGSTLKVDWVRLLGADPKMDLGVTLRLPKYDTNGWPFWDRDEDYANNVQDYLHGGSPGWSGFAPNQLTWTRKPGTVLVPDSATLTLPIDGMPPGRYRFFISHDYNPKLATEWSTWITIRARPRPVLLTPNSLQGTDYATAVRHNPWNMDQPADYVLRNARLVGANGRWIAADNTSNDPSVTLPLPKPFSGSTYHRVRINLALLGAYGLANAPGGGCVGRLLWTTATGGTAKWQTTDDLVLYPGWNTIDLDMATSPSSAIVDPALGAKRIGWAGQTITRLRFDPNEDPGKRRWYLDDIKVAAEPVSSGGRFDLKFTDLSGTSGTTATVVALGGGNRRYTVAENVPVGAGTNTVTWRPGRDVPADRYRFQLTLTNNAGSVTQRGLQLVRIIPA